MSLTLIAFDKFRGKYSPARAPNTGMIRNSDEVIQMTAEDGLEQWSDGVATTSAAVPLTPKIDDTLLSGLKLWAVRATDVVHAHEKCAFGKTLETQVIKHTNLTGGDDAYCGGELLFLSDSTIVVNGYSGRYGPKSEREMEDVALAFRQSGFNVWSSGYDEESGKPYSFIGVDPVWVP
jgi:hypothetical protein